MDFHLIWIITIAGIVTLGLLFRLFAPGLYDRYVLRGAPPAARSSGKSSRAVAIIMLVGIIFIGAHLFFSGRNPSVRRTPVFGTTEMHIQTWISMILVSITAIILLLFPTAVVTKFSQGAIDVSRVDERGRRKIKFFVRTLGALFLVGAALIVWRVL